MPARCVAIAPLLLAACSLPAETLEPSGVAERPDGPVLDEAAIFAPAAEAALDQDLTEYLRTSGVSMFVVTDASLDGETIEHVAYETFEELRVGDAKTNCGLLVLVAPSEKMVRIEVGRGLEGDVSDVRAKRIIENAMLPLYRAGDIPGGTLAGVEELKRAAPNPPQCREGAPL
ncbi:MAG: TPM domain-containing protein [Pseudomonadota bacterium]|nr:TPM domain-containing protein [Pseudomonadota bacterium]